MYFDSRKDATLVQSAGENKKLFKSIEMEKYYVVVGQPGEFYLSHTSPKDGKNRAIAKCIYDFIKDNDFEGNLIIVGSGDTASITGANTRCIGAFEELSVDRSTGSLVCRSVMSC